MDDEEALLLLLLVLLRREDAATDNSASDLSPKKRGGWVVVAEMEEACCCKKLVLLSPNTWVAVDSLLTDDEVDDVTLRPIELNNEFELANSELKSPVVELEDDDVVPPLPTPPVLAEALCDRCIDC